MLHKIRVLIADDHAILREGIKAFLQLHEDMEVVGEAADGHEAIEKAATIAPEVVLMDIAMPGLGGLEATQAIADKTKVLVLTQYENKEYIFRFFKAGARGYILKKAMGTELVSAIRAVFKGETYVHSAVASEIVAHFVKEKDQEIPPDSYELLSEREKQVFKLIAEGYSSKEIASSLEISVKTAMSHRTNIMAKLAIHNRTDLIKLAIAKGLIS